jgi:uncharacterized membrane protein YphA (DoxX/SURF4 family)
VAANYRIDLSNLIQLCLGFESFKNVSLMIEEQNINSVADSQELAIPAPRWKSPSLFIFRFVFSYVILFIGSFSGFFAPLSLPVAALSKALWQVIVPWVAIHILDVPAPPLFSDGDGLGQWIQFVGCGVFVVVAMVIWSVFDRRRNNYDTLHQWLRVLMRYALGVAMFTYGLFKVFHLQMLPPHLTKLVQSYGDSSPTSLLWIFLGSSAAYSAFTGVAEVLGGLLLFNRRTTTLGALVTFGALGHVLAL